MPATSVAQQQAAGAELARRRRGLKPSRFKGMSEEELRHLASTPTKGLPERADAKGRRKQKGGRRSSRDDT